MVEVCSGASDCMFLNFLFCSFHAFRLFFFGIGAKVLSSLYLEDRPAYYCANAPQTIFNEEYCKMSFEPNTCSQGGISVLRTLKLDEDQLLDLYTLTGRYVYKIEGLIFDETIMPSTATMPSMPETIVDTPCMQKTRSRWRRKNGVDVSDCMVNSLSTLQPDTITALETAIRITNDPNEFFKDGMRLLM